MNKHSNNIASQLRRAWIERQLSIAGTFNLELGVQTLKCSRAQISAELAALQAGNPGITYDQRKKHYAWTTGAKLTTKLPSFVSMVAVTDHAGITIHLD